MKSCTFFGHRNSPDSIEGKLYEVIEGMIIDEAVQRFYVGNQGNFDRIVCAVLDELRKKHTHIQCVNVLAYMPDKNSEEHIFPTLLPEGLENVPRKFAILKRNGWMLDNSQIAVTYVKRSRGGAAKFSELAYKKGLKVINIE